MYVQPEPQQQQMYVQQEPQRLSGQYMVDARRMSMNRISGGGCALA